MSITTGGNLGPFITAMIGAVIGITFGVTTRNPIGGADTSSASAGLCFFALTPPLLGVLTVAFATREQRGSNLYATMMPWLAATIFCGMAVTFAYGFLYAICLIAPYTLISASIGGISTKIIWQHSRQPEAEPES